MAGKSTVSTPELAAMLGISRQRVNELGRKGKLTREPDGRWDPEKAKAAIGANLDARQVSPARGEAPPKTVGTKANAAEPEEAKEPPHGSLAWEQLQHEREKRLKTALERKRLEGELIDAKEASIAWSNMISEAKAALLSAGDEIADVLAAEANPIRCRELVNEKVREALAHLAEYPSVA